MRNPNKVKDHLVTYPSSSCIEAIQPYLASSPFKTIPPESWFVSIAVADKQIAPEDIIANAPYCAKSVTAELWYDALLEMTNLVIVLESQGLSFRNNSIRSMYGVSSPCYVPHITIVHGFVLAMSAKGFADSFSVSMNRIGEEMGEGLQLSGEFLLDSAGYVPNYDGQKMYAENHGLI